MFFYFTLCTFLLCNSIEGHDKAADIPVEHVDKASYRSVQAAQYLCDENLSRGKLGKRFYAFGVNSLTVYKTCLY